MTNTIKSDAEKAAEYVAKEAATEGKTLLTDAVSAVESSSIGKTVVADAQKAESAIVKADRTVTAWIKAKAGYIALAVLAGAAWFVWKHVL